MQQSLQKYQSIPNGSTVKSGWCGEFVNDYLNTMGIEGRMFVDPIDVRATQINSKTPTIGSVVIFDRSGDPKASPEAKKYGHVAIVTGVNADGTFRIKEQNGTVAKKVGERTIKANASSVI